MLVSTGLPKILIVGCLAAIALSIAWPAARIGRPAGFAWWRVVLAAVPGGHGRRRGPGGGGEPDRDP